MDQGHCEALCRSNPALRGSQAGLPRFARNDVRNLSYLRVDLNSSHHGIATGHSCRNRRGAPSTAVMHNISSNDPVGWHGTTILCVRRDGKVAMAGDGQVSLGNTVVKGNARKVRRIGAGGKVLAGFAGATADAFTLLERLEAKLER